MSQSVREGAREGGREDDGEGTYLYAGEREGR